MARSITEHRVFIATPGGLDEERRAFREELREYNEVDAVRRGLLFTPVGWEDTLGGARRPQSLINHDLVTCDWFVLVLWNRWGSAPDIEGPYTSGCEEEFDLALECLKDPSRPMREVVVFFKWVDPQQLADPGPQLQKVLEFRRRLEESKEHLFMTFDEPLLFRSTLRRYLARWVHAYERGVLEPRKVVQPAAPIEEEPSHVPLLEEAERLADEGRLTDAEALFAKSIVAGSDPEAFNRYGHFLRRFDRLAQAKVMYERVVDLGKDCGAEWMAKGYGNLGVVYQIRSEDEHAEEMFLKAKEIYERLDRHDGVADQYSNLGLVYQTRGQLDRAEQAFLRAMDIYRELGHQGLADLYSNMGVIYQARGEIELAERTFSKALEIEEKFGRREDQSIQVNPLFISYSHADAAFVDKIESEFSKRGIHYWRDVHDLRAGRLETQIDRAIQVNSTVLLVLSENSVESDWVEWEVAKARDLEKSLNREILCPVALDDAWKSSDWPTRLRAQIVEYHILDFSGWREKAVFERQFLKLLGGLKLFYKRKMS